MTALYFLVFQAKSSPVYGFTRRTSAFNCRWGKLQVKETVFLYDPVTNTTFVKVLPGSKEFDSFEQSIALSI